MDQPAAKTKPKISAAKSAGQSQPPSNTSPAKPSAAGTIRGLQHDLESNFRAVLRANLTRLDLVARDEFTAQTRVLERTRARLEELERRVAELEARMPP
ncbi:MAG: accessory factor UbiK family protein [Alphaproteobacteria bacterium]